MTTTRALQSEQALTPGTDLVAGNRAHFPGESQAYRTARNALLLEEIALRRQLEHVAEMRRELPAGGAVDKEYDFTGEQGPVTLEQLFGEHDTLVVYNYMFGPQRKNPCPMCTSLMAAWDHKVPDIEQRVALACVARSPIERLIAAKKARGWQHLKLYSDESGDFTRDYVNAQDADVPGYTVFTRKDGTIRHFWSGEMSGEMADPGQDPRGAPDLDPLWNLLDTTPEGRGTDWYPKLSYAD